jgi:hypothetical protein
VRGDDTLDRRKFLYPAALSAQTAPAPPPQPVNSQSAQPAFQVQSVDQQPSLGEAGRHNRARKAQETQTPTQDQHPER